MLFLALHQTTRRPQRLRSTSSNSPLLAWTWNCYLSTEVHRWQRTYLNVTVGFGSGGGVGGDSETVMDLKSTDTLLGDKSNASSFRLPGMKVLLNELFRWYWKQVITMSWYLRGLKLIYAHLPKSGQSWKRARSGLSFGRAVGQKKRLFLVIVLFLPVECFEFGSRVKQSGGLRILNLSEPESGKERESNDNKFRPI